MNIHARKFRKGGNIFIALPEQEFANLLELANDMEDIGDARKILADIASGKEKTFPAKIAYQLMNPENNA